MTSQVNLGQVSLKLDILMFLIIPFPLGDAPTFKVFYGNILNHSVLTTGAVFVVSPPATILGNFIT